MNEEHRGLGFAPASADDYRALARKRLPRQLFDYLDGAAYEEVTARENHEAFGRLRLRQRVMRDVSRVNLSRRVLGLCGRGPRRDGRRAHADDHAP